MTIRNFITRHQLLSTFLLAIVIFSIIVSFIIGLIFNSLVIVIVFAGMLVFVLAFIFSDMIIDHISQKKN